MTFVQLPITDLPDDEQAEFRRLCSVAAAYAMENLAAPSREWLREQGFSDLVLHMGGYN